MARQRTVVLQAGEFAGGVDVAWVIGASAITFVFDRALKSSKNDVIFALVELLLGGVIAMGTAKAREAAGIRNSALGVANGAAIYLLDKVVPD